MIDSRIRIARAFRAGRARLLRRARAHDSRATARRAQERQSRARRLIIAVQTARFDRPSRSFGDRSDFAPRASNASIRSIIFGTLRIFRTPAIYSGSVDRGRVVNLRGFVLAGNARVLFTFVHNLRFSKFSTTLLKFFLFLFSE